MRLHIRSGVVALALCGTATVSCAEGSKPPEQAVLYDRQDLVSGLTDAPRREAYVDSFPVGPEGRQAHLRVVWTSGTDSTGCLRVRSIRVERGAGDREVAVDSVRNSPIPCGSEWEGVDTTRFETVLLHLRARRPGARTYEFSGGGAQVTATGVLRRF